tara:strand:- start:301 stop:501 length:201 start_codon:yes stop_codon:yes gene_type:complete
MKIPRIPKDASMEDLLILAQVSNDLLVKEIYNVSTLVVPSPYIDVMNMVTIILARCLAIEHKREEE